MKLTGAMQVTVGAAPLRNAALPTARRRLPMHRCASISTQHKQYVAGSRRRWYEMSLTARQSGSTTDCSTVGWHARWLSGLQSQT